MEQRETILNLLFQRLVRFAEKEVVSCCNIIYFFYTFDPKLSVSLLHITNSAVKCDQLSKINLFISLKFLKFKLSELSLHCRPNFPFLTLISIF